MPEFKLLDFNTMTIKKYTSTISENDIDNVLNKLRNENKTFKRAELIELREKMID